ncbi:hypothetical protein ABIE52_006760 [Rhodococcus sp. OAS809]|uniref:hypothetical protein n=1 Tax=Rhodococcus sp. OAS809 TaxID=2663874 RepID=UPI00178B0C66
MTDDIDFFSDVDPAILEDAGSASETSASEGKSSKSTFGRVVGEARSRLSRGDGSSNSLNADARLASVVSESTAAAALELMRLNAEFSIAELNAYVLLVLPTAGEFGGLNRRSKDEARGTIINLINADNIHAVVTMELLADDALGIVPDTESLARMSEISLLTDARYLYGVACEDVDTGEVKVFSVPPISEETAVSGKLFEQASQISRGEIALASVLDRDLIAAMLTIYRSAGDSMSATAALNKAEDMNMEFVVKAVQQGGYPTPGELVSNLATEFSSLASQLESEGSSGRHHATGQETDSADSDASEVDAEPNSFEDADLFDPTEDVPDFDPSDLELEFGHSVDGLEPDISDEALGLDLIDDAEAEESDDEPDWSEPDFGAPAPSSGAPDAAFVSEAVIKAAGGQIIEVLRSDISGFFEEIQKNMAPAQRSTEGGLAIVDGVDRSGPITVEPGSEFTYDQALEAAGRIYNDDDLGLSVDPKPFKERLVSPIPQVPVPRGSHTPWLGEQAAMMAEVFNEQLRKMHVDNEQMLYRQFMHMADLAAKEISWEFDPERNPDSRWGRVYSAIQSDREKAAERAAPAKMRAEEAVRELWNARADLFVSDAAARARQEYEHRNGAHIEADVRKAGDQVLADLESMNVMNLAELNERRGVSARLQMDEKLSDILYSLESKALEQQADEAAAFEAALAAVTAYIEEHRKDDLLQSDVTARKLETDARYEQLMSEAQTQISAARTEAEARIEMMKTEMTNQTEAYERGLTLKAANFQLELSNHSQREETLQRQLDQISVDHEKEKRELLKRADARVEMADKARDEAIADKETLRERDARMTTAAVVLVVLGAIVLVALGILAGAFLI